MISFISSLEIISVIIPDVKVFFWIAASVADAAAVNPSGIKTFVLVYNKWCGKLSSSLELGGAPKYVWLASF